MKRSCIPLCSMAAIFLVLVGACVVILLQNGMKDKSSTKAVAVDSVNHSKGPVKTTEHDSPDSAKSLKRPGARNSTHKDQQRRFCRTCCQTPPCWYNNHKECSKCANRENIELEVSRLLRRSFKKAIHHHKREKLRMKKTLRNTE